MKKRYKTSELCELFDISLDTLRYYEKLGLIHTKRNQHQQRCFTLEDIYRLIAIRNMHTFHIPRPIMKQYLQHTSIASSLSILKQEEQRLKEQLQEIEGALNGIHRQIELLTTLPSIQLHCPEVLSLPERTCLILQEMQTQDVLYQKTGVYEQQQQLVLRNLDQYLVGTLLDTKELFQFQPSLCIVCDDTLEEYDLLLPAGRYVTMYCHKDQNQQRQALTFLLSYCIEHGYEVDSLILSFSITHLLHTQNEKEHVIQLQIKLK